MLHRYIEQCRRLCRSYAHELARAEEILCEMFLMKDCGLFEDLTVKSFYLGYINSR